jgi:DNA-binding CsgD family transcriptional regulator
MYSEWGSQALRGIGNRHGILCQEQEERGRTPAQSDRRLLLPSEPCGRRRVIDSAAAAAVAVPTGLKLRGLEPLTMAGGTRDVQLALLDHRLPMGVLTLDATGKVLAKNTVARRILNDRDGLSLQQSCVVAARPAESAKLQRLVHEVCRNAEKAAGVAGRALRVSRPSGRRGFNLFVAPLRLWGVVGASESPTAVLLITDPGRPMQTWRELLRAYGLTEAETQVALLSLQGARIDEIAQRRGTTRHTARAQMKSVLAKIGAECQADLVRILLTGPTRPSP